VTPAVPAPLDRPNASRPRGRPPLPESDVTARRLRIVDAAARMFFAEGFAETTLEAIGREAGVTKRTIYELIGDKNAVFRAACAKMQVQGPKFAFHIPVEGRTAREVLAHMARQLVDHAFNSELIALERAVMVESTRSPQLVGTVVADGKVRLDRAITDIFAEMAANGLIRPASFDRAAGIFYDVAVGARGFRAALGHPGEAPTDADLLERVDMFLHGYLERVAAP
jgi:TetR/AcrR family transcriptional repressor of mexJK operon